MQAKLSNPIILRIAQAIAQALETLSVTDMPMSEIYHQISPTPNLDMGHYAFGCFPLAKRLRKAPPLIAQSLVQALAQSLPSQQLEASTGDGPHDETIESVEAAGPYLNFKVCSRAFGKHLIQSVNQGVFFERTLIDKPTRMMFEYSQPNTHKELHVGHLRNLCMGNAIVSLNRFIGQDVIPVTYPGDVGTHVAKCLWYIHYRAQSPLPTEKHGEWLAQMYVAGNALLEEEKGTPQEAENRAQLTQILKEIHDQSGPFFELWEKTREWSLDQMRRAYDWAGVTFDRWFFESEMDEPSLAYMHELHEAGKLVKDQGAIGMNLEEDGLGFCLLVKSDGTGLYATKDVELARRKFEEFGVEQNIIIVDNRQTLHFQQVFKVLERIGFAQAKDCLHLPYEMVELPSGAMSSRKGNVVPFMALAESMEAHIVEMYLEKYRGDWPDEEIEAAAHSIANSAIKYGMNRFDNNRKIIFDMDDWLRLDGETGPYLQYAVARMNALLDKIRSESAADFALLTAPQELALMIKLNEFHTIVFRAATQFKAAHLCAYLYELAKLFSSFYAECSIAQADSEPLKSARLALVQSSKGVLERGLGLLGITCPDRM
jgi:arginyl-tRNA synthetase